MKIFYTHFITDNVYHIYKFSIYGREKVKLIHAGLAFDNRGNYSKEFTKYQTKYNLNPYGFECTAHSYKEFLNRLYLISHKSGVMANTVEYHPIIFDILKYWYDRSNNVLKEKADELKNDLLECAQAIPGKEDEFDMTLRILKSRFR